MNASTPNLLKKEHFSPPDTHSCVFDFVNDKIIRCRHRKNFKWVENDDVILVGDVLKPQNNKTKLGSLPPLKISKLIFRVLCFT